MQSTTWVITNTNDSGEGSLRQAILNANASPGVDTVVFDGEVFANPQTIYLQSKLSITDDLLILGTGAQQLILSGDRDLSNTNTAGDVRVFEIQSGTVQLRDLTLAGGRAEGEAGQSGAGGGGGAAGMGGALLIADGHVTLSNVVLANNQAIGGRGGESLGYTAPLGGQGGNSPLGAGGAGAGVLDWSFSGKDGGFGAGGGGARNGAGFNFPNFYFGMGGNGGFGAGGGSPTAGVKYYGPSGSMGGLHGNFGNAQTGGGGGAGLGGAIFIRTGTLVLHNATFVNNASVGGANFVYDDAALAEGKGGAVYSLSTLTNSIEGQVIINNQGMPSALPVVRSRGSRFVSNHATAASGHTSPNGIGTAQDNTDIYGSIAQESLPSVISGTRHADRLMGTSELDTLKAKRGDDRVVGQAGDDELLGMGGDDLLRGGAGQDWLIGGGGRDCLMGETGADYFVFSGNTAARAFVDSTIAAMDTIQGFDSLAGDRLRLDTDNNPGTANLPDRLINAGKQTGDRLAEVIHQIYQDKLPHKGHQHLRSHEAALFSWRNQWYITVNNAQRGVSDRQDFLVRLSKTDLGAAQLAQESLTVTDYFV